MTKEPSFPAVPPGSSAIRDGMADACASPAMLSAYLDGNLNPVERGLIEDHISRCQDCYFVVRESAQTWPEDKAQRAPGRPFRAFSVRRYLLPMAATLIVTMGAVVLWKQAQARPDYSEAVRPLVEAVGARRFFVPRLTGGFKYGPAVSVQRSGASEPDPGAWGMLLAAGKLLNQPESGSFAVRGSRAAAALFAGDDDRAIALFSQLTRDDPATAAWPCNLAAALLVRAAIRGTKADETEALRSAEAALRLDPNLVEARFNRGLALKATGRLEEARLAFSEIQGEGDGWGEAVKAQLRELSQAAMPRREQR